MIALQNFVVSVIHQILCTLGRGGAFLSLPNFGRSLDQVIQFPFLVLACICLLPENLEPQFTHPGPWDPLWGAPCASRMEASFIIENNVSQIPALLK